MVAVPKSPATPCTGYADPSMVFEVLYAVLVFNYVLDFRCDTGETSKMCVIHSVKVASFQFSSLLFLNAKMAGFSTYFTHFTFLHISHPRFLFWWWWEKRTNVCFPLPRVFEFQIPQALLTTGPEYPGFLHIVVKKDHNLTLVQPEKHNLSE